MKKSGLILTATLALTACNQPAQQNQSQATQGQSHFEQLANLHFSENRPTPDTAQTLKDETPLPARHPDISLGHAPHQHLGHESGL
jgi:hypothetical protein